MIIMHSHQAFILTHILSNKENHNVSKELEPDNLIVFEEKKRGYDFSEFRIFPLSLLHGTKLVL